MTKTTNQAMKSHNQARVVYKHKNDGLKEDERGVVIASER